MIPDRSDDWANRRVFEPLAWIAFLYRKLVQEAKKRSRSTQGLDPVETAVDAPGSIETNF